MSPIDPITRRSIDAIILQIRTGKVIPVIGYELLTDGITSSDTNDNDFLKYLIKIHAERVDVGNVNTTADKTGYEIINDYYHKLSDNKEAFKIQFSDTIQVKRSHWPLTYSSFRKLSSIKNFQLFINATFLNSLEVALNQMCGVGTNEDEIKSSYSVLNYRSFNPEDLPERAAEGKGFHINFPKPIIYNLFGTHNDPRGDYVLTDADYIELIYDLMVNKQGLFTNLLSYLKEGFLLFLGCSFPDWFFRFFIRICVGDRLDTVSPIKRKAVIDSLNGLDASRTVFINHYGIQKLDIDCNVLIDEIYKAFSNVPGKPDLHPDRFNNNIFISYCRKDEKTAADMASQFNENYIEYFLDNHEMETGSFLDRTIQEAIERCCIFLPIVSNNLSSGTAYFCKEWNYAIDKGKIIIPVFKEFVDQNMFLPCNPHTNIRQMILNKDAILGIKLSPDNKISDDDLKIIKERQYKCKASSN